MGHSFGGADHPAPARPRPRRRRRRDRLGPDQGRARAPGQHAADRVPRAQEPEEQRTGRSRSPPRSSTTRSPTRSPTRSRWRCTSATPCPAPAASLFQAAFANFNPHAATKVDFHNDDRAPLLIIAGGDDHVSPDAINRSEAKHQQQVGGHHRVPGVPRPLALHARPGRLGGGRRLRAGLGARPRRHPGLTGTRVVSVGPSRAASCPRDVMSSLGKIR